MSVFDFQSYKKYLNTLLNDERGGKGRLARFVGCQSSFLSQVLKSDINFSLEHAIKVNQYFSHDEDEAEFFLLLVQKERAGSVDLEKFFQKQIKKILIKRSKIKERIKVSNSLDEKDLMLYYSQWYYSAIHILCAINEFDTEKKIAEKLKLSHFLVKNVIKFLLEKNLVKEEKGKYSIGNARIHIDINSPLFIKHHTNWRLESIKALENNCEESLHYSGVLALSKNDYLKIREILLKSIETSEKILADSPEEILVSLSMDLYELNPN